MPDANEAKFLFTVESGAFFVSRFMGKEALSAPYYFRIHLVVDDDAVNMADLLKTRARLTFLTNYGKKRHINGIISQVVREERNPNFSVYSVVLCPMFRLMGWRTCSRIFQGMSVPDIIGDVLKKFGFSRSDFVMRLSDDHPPRDYCVQYRETDMDFISRLAEEEGIFFFFTQGENRETVVFGDGISAVPWCAPESSVAYHPKTGTLETNEETLHHCGMDVRVYSGKVVLNDYNYEKPAMPLRSMSAASVHQELEIYDHPGGYHEPGQGDALSKIRRESVGFRAQTLNGRGTFRCLSAGHKFTITQSADAGLYVVYEASHKGSQTQAMFYRQEGEAGSTYECSFEATPAEVSVRAPIHFKKPPVPIQTAVVVGPPGEEIYTDENGRVKVQFHWDREGENNEKSSCWIRVSQAWAGAGWGAMYIPRIGQEVVVDFIEGDPDRPIIIGQVYNGENLPPYPNDKTKSGVKSNSSSGGGGFNEVRFEDKKGKEEFFTHAQKDQNEIVGNCMTTTIKANKILLVEKNRTTAIKSGNDTLTVEKGSRDVEVKKGNEMHKNGADFIHEVKGNFELNVGGNLTINVTGTATIKGKAIHLNP